MDKMDSFWLEHNTKLWAFLGELEELCDRYNVFLDKSYSIEISPPTTRFELDFMCESSLLYEKVDLLVKDNLKHKTMGAIKKVLFTDIKNETTKEINVGEIGHYVFELTKDTTLMNMAIRALAKHDTCEHELFRIEVVREEG
jgi:hypothetical protein